MAARFSDVTAGATSLATEDGTKVVHGRLTLREPLTGTRGV
jgi:hypothetical protein